MASLTLYPPIVESSMPAFVANENAVCKVYFSLSQFNTRRHFENVQISVVKLDSGLNVVKRVDGQRYRATGVILNVPVHSTDKENLWYVEILNEDIGYQMAQGWTAGWFYKIQIRLSSVTYEPSADIGQAAWLNKNSHNFSEWSTVTLVKAIGQTRIQIPILAFDSLNKEDNVDSASLAISTLDINGTYSCEDTSEILHSYQIELYKDNELLDSSGVLYSNQYVDSNEFSYVCKADLADSTDVPYILKFTYKTVNDYEGEENISFTVLQALIGETQVTLKIYGEPEVGEIMDIDTITTIAEEEDEGRVGIRFQDISGNKFSGNLCIRRTDSKSDFKVWQDIGVIVVINQLINEIPIFYDYTVESGISYKYGVQTITNTGGRTNLNVTDKKVIRSFEYSYLLGKNNQQLKLMFNNNMNDYKEIRTDSKTDTIGGAFPFITRNGSTRYKTFPLTGLISFYMDESNTFLSKEKVIALRADRRDGDVYTEERDFREEVLKFLLDGQPKLFKSPTEGNIIIRLTDISCTPEQSLGRLLYNFSATAYEIAEPTMENYLKYGFYTIRPYQTDFSISEMKIGQLQQNFKVTDNICELIKNKYNTVAPISNHIQKVKRIIGLKITIEDDPLRIMNSAEVLVLGNNFLFNNKLITIYGTTRVYEFDEDAILTTEDSLYLLGDAEGSVEEVRATIDFVYEHVTTKDSSRKEVATTMVLRGVGQTFQSVSPGDSLYSILYYKYYIEWVQEYRRLNRLWSIEIEANPGTIFKIKDALDENSELHEVNDTGILRFSELSNIVDITYYGIREKDGTINMFKNTDVCINYLYYLLKGTYK